MWAVTGSFAKYVAAISNSIADQSSAAGNPQSFSTSTRVPTSTRRGPVTPTPDAIKAVFAWYDTNKANLVLVGNPTIPGLTPRIGPDLHSPFTYDYSAGVSRQFNRASLRADYLSRLPRFLCVHHDSSTGKVANSFGQTFDLALIENTDLLKRHTRV